MNDIYVRAELCLKISNYKKYYKALIAFSFLFCVCLAHAGQRGNIPAATGVASTTDSIKPLTIGDTIPEALWNLPLQMVQAGQEGITAVTLNDYKGKLIILDFWATWCGGCIAGFPKMETLANKFDHDLVVLPIGYDAAEKIRYFMQTNENGQYLKRSIYDAKVLKQYFPHVYIPHYVWLKDTHVVSITNQIDLNEANIVALLKGEKSKIKVKKDVLDYDRSKPFFANLNKTFLANMQVSLTLTRHVDGLSRSGTGGLSDDSLLRWTSFINTPLIDLYRFAVNLPYNHFINETADKSLLGNLDNDPNWYEKYAYCLEIVAPNESSSLLDLKSNVIHALNTQLKLNGRLEYRLVDVYAMRAIHLNERNRPEQQKKTLTGSSLSEIAKRFNNNIKIEKRKVVYNPIVINDMENIAVPSPSMNAYQSITTLNTYLNAMGITLVKDRKELAVFVLSEK